MARVRSPEKRRRILEAAVLEIAEAGLGAPTAKIAQRAGVASGTLFTYFASKDELLNELHVSLKLEIYALVNADFPHKGSLEQRARRVWSSFIDWAIASPAKWNVSIQLNLSDLVTLETRERTAAERGAVDKTLRDLQERGALSGLPKGFAGATMQAMLEATMGFVAKQPRQRKVLIEQAFAIFWRAVR